MTFKRVSLLVIPIIIIYYVTAPTLCAQDNPGGNEPIVDSTFNRRIVEEKFVLINGIQQWVTIKGESLKPVILFLHGGPGSPMSPYSDNLYKDWEKDFVIVQWDQRGAGKTFGIDAPEELRPEYVRSNPLTIEQMSTDGIALAEYLLKYLKKKKIILFGTSWGSVLGVTMATKRPDLFYAYVGHSQITNPSDDLPLYNKVYQMAEHSNDQESLEILRAIGKPPYGRARTTGQLLKVVKKYERKNSLAPPGSWFIESKDYYNAKADQDRRNGDDYSFVNYVGDQQMGIPAMRSSINFPKNNYVFNIPIYLIQGEEDLLTPKETTKAYFDKIKAPQKKYFQLPKTAHGFNQSVLEAQYNIFKSIQAR